MKGDLALRPGDLRIVMIGEPSVGKTCLLNRFVEDSFCHDTVSTVAASYKMHSADFRGQRADIQIWDTAGQEKFRALVPIYYRYAAGAVAVYDITQVPSYERLQTWIDCFFGTAGSDAIVAIAANKADLLGDAEMDISAAREEAEAHGYMFQLTSAQTGAGVSQLFDQLIERILIARFEKPEKEAIVEAGGPSAECAC
jgi:small GTP-binding protein